MYKAGTRELKYAFQHTLNDKGNPDTLRLDPNTKYDIEVHTIPMVTKKNIQIFKGKHNIIDIDAPQGMIKFSSAVTNKSIFIQSRVASLDNKTLNVQPLNTTEKYIVGKYFVEILTLPRITKTVDVTQSQINNILIDAPGSLSYKFNFHSVGQLLVKNSQGSWDWVINLEEKEGLLQLQPGEYKVVYRKKQAKKTELEGSKEFRITSNKSILIAL
jgi:Ca-activated chloride channel family protein